MEASVFTRERIAPGPKPAALAHLCSRASDQVSPRAQWKAGPRNQIRQPSGLFRGGTLRNRMRRPCHCATHQTPGRIQSQRPSRL